MPFDPNTARPLGGGFDAASAKPAPAAPAPAKAGIVTQTRNALSNATGGLIGRARAARSETAPQGQFDPKTATIPRAAPTSRPNVSRDIGTVATDIGAKAAAGANMLVSNLGDVYGLATGDTDNIASEQGRSGREFWEARVSPELKALEADRQARIDSADGEFAKAGTALWETLRSPSLLSAFLAEQAPMLVPSAVAGRGAGLIGRAMGASPRAAGAAGTGAAVAVGAAQQGADAGSGAYERLLALPDDLWSQNADYQALVAQGIAPEQAKQQAALDLSRNAAVASALESGALNLLPGARILERALAGAGGRTGGRLANAAKGFVGESAQEGLEEAGGQFAGNLAVGAVDPAQDPTAGVGEAGGLGAAAGPFGALAGAVEPVQEQAPRPAPRTTGATPTVRTGDVLPPEPTKTDVDQVIEATARDEIIPVRPRGLIADQRAKAQPDTGPRQITDQSPTGANIDVRAPSVEMVDAARPPAEGIAQRAGRELTERYERERDARPPASNIEVEEQAPEALDAAYPPDGITVNEDALDEFGVETVEPAAPIDAIADEAATSPKNDLPEPSEAQKDAGNYTKGHHRLAGMDLSIENPAGSSRRPEWPPLKAHYGYIKGTVGHDKDHVDIFVRPGTPDEWTGPVYVVNQTNADGSFDEHKAMFGYDSREAAEQGYLDQYEQGWDRYTDIVEMPQDAFKAWAYDSSKAGPAGGPAGATQGEGATTDTPAPDTRDPGDESALDSEFDRAAYVRELEDDLTRLRQQADTLDDLLKQDQPADERARTEQRRETVGEAIERVKADLRAYAPQEDEPKKKQVPETTKETPAKDAAPSVPAKRGQLFIDWYGRRHPVEDFADAQAKWDRFRTESGGGGSEIGEAKVVDQNGETVARISYNGRIWEPGEGGKEIVIPGQAERGLTEESRARSDEAAAQARAETKELPAATGEFNEGDRVVIGNDHPNKDFRGRHGVVTKADKVRTIQIQVFGGRAPVQDDYRDYTVRTDAGAELSALRDKDLRPETGSAPEVTPDIEVEGKFYQPEAVLRVAEVSRKNAEGSRDREARARKPEKKAAHRRSAEAADQRAARYQAAFDAWAAEHPEAAAPLRKAPEPPPTAAPVATAGGVLRVEDYSDKAIIVRGDTRPHKDRIKAIGGALWNRKAGGWIFKQAKRAEVERALADLLSGQIQSSEDAKPPSRSRTEIGVNRDGNPVSVDEQGVRWVTKEGVRQSEPGTVIGRSGPNFQFRSDPVRRPDEFKTVDELAAERTAGATDAVTGRKADVIDGSVGDLKLIGYPSQGGRQNIAQFKVNRDGTASKLKYLAENAQDRALADAAYAEWVTENDKRRTVRAREAQRASFKIGQRVVPIRDRDVLPSGEITHITTASDGRQMFRVGDSNQHFRAEDYALADEPRTVGRPFRLGDKVRYRTGFNKGTFTVYDYSTEDGGKVKFHEDQPKIWKNAMDFVRVEDDPQANVSPAAPAAAPQSSAPAPAFGATNTVFTEDAADRARALLKAKLGNLNTGLDPEVIQAGITLAGYYIEGGARAFAEFSKRMIADLGEGARPYLRSWYEGVRYYPGFDARDMTSAAEIDAILEAGAPETDDGLQDPLPDSDAGAEPDDVSRAPEERAAGRAPAGEERGGAPAATGSDRGAEEGPADRAAEKPQRAPRSGRAGPRDADRVPDGPARNYLIEPGALQEGRGWAQKARDNLRAIEIARDLEASGRHANAEEQAALALYVGWGGMSGAFPDTQGAYGKGFEKIGPQIRDLLTDREYETARRSIQYAHYTSESVIRAMWDAASQLGFKGGRVFEPGMGVGHFAGMMPAEIAASTEYAGLELDHTTARIARLLYPKWGVRQDDFTRAPLPENAYDLVIGNPPFADIAIKSDPKYAAHGFLLHDYFFAKSLDAVRPGGLLMFISSAGTMNKQSAAARAYLAERADLVGAIRLPSSAFKKNAGTEVTTDIIILRKHDDTPYQGHDFVESAPVTLPDKDGKPRDGYSNTYFESHPEMVLGEQGFFDKLYEGRYGVRPRPGQDLEADMNAAIARLPRDVMGEPHDAPSDIDFATTEKKDGSYYLREDGTLMQHSDGVGRPVEQRGKGVTGGKSKAEIERIRGLIPIRDALRAVYSFDLAQDTKNAAAARERLNEAYDAFVKRFGPINKADIKFRRPSRVQAENARTEAREEARYAGRTFEEGSFDPRPLIAAGESLATISRLRMEAREAALKAGQPWDEGTFDPDDMPDLVVDKRPNADPFIDDPEVYRLRAIEDYDDDKGTGKKGLVFFESVLSKEKAPEIRNAGDAMLYVLNRHGFPDLDEIAKLAGSTRDEVLAELGNNLFEIPGRPGVYETRDDYLSGNVRAKLEAAKAAAETNPRLRKNVDALEAVQPTPLPPAMISANLGMPWIPTEVIEQFATEELGLERATVRFVPKLGDWTVDGDSKSAAAVSTYGTERMDATRILQHNLNRTQIKIYDTWRDSDGTHSVLNEKATQAALQKAAEIKHRFGDWIYRDQDRADRLADLYNAQYNNIRAWEGDGSYLTTPGVAANWSWRPHQLRVIARIIRKGNTYMAHAVGAGKTSASIGSVMEMRRLGLIKKPMFAVPNHMLAQFTKEFYEQYPLARIAVADERRFHTDRRKQFIADVASRELDAIIITHSSFGMIPLSSEFQDSIIKEEIDNLREILAELGDREWGEESETRITRKRVEKQIERLEQRLSGAMRSRKDQVFTFEEMGVDFLVVDEAHEFRKLDFATKIGHIKGISAEGAQKSMDLYSKLRYLRTLNPDRHAVLMSGTPITNTMAELYSVSRYLQEDELAARGLGAFDAWAAAYGDTVDALEQDPAGGYKTQSRFASFVNVPELSAMVRQVMDVVTSSQLSQYVTRPAIKGGKRRLEVAGRSDAFKSYQQDLAYRMHMIELRKGPPKKGDDILLNVINDGRHAAIDMRFVIPDIGKTDPESKLDRLVEEVYRIWQDTKDQAFYRPLASGKYSDEPVMTGPATQMIFANLGIGDAREFNTYRYIIAELVARGVPRSEIVDIRDAKTQAARQRVFNDMNEGKVRVLIGSTSKMATGVNAQRRLVAIHNLDPLWYPADDEQRIGRGLRQGNMNREIEIVDYSTDGSYDSQMWALMEKKARFIEGFFRGDPTMRTMDDLGESSQYAQAKAMTTADPRIIELTELRQELEMEELRRASAATEAYQARRHVENARATIASATKAIAQYEGYIKQRVDITGDNFYGQIGDTLYKDRDEFVKGMNAALREAGEARVAKAGEDGKSRDVEMALGDLGGFRLTAEISTSREIARDKDGQAIQKEEGGKLRTQYKVVYQAHVYLNWDKSHHEWISGRGGKGVLENLETAIASLEDRIADRRDQIKKAEKAIADFTPRTEQKYDGDAKIAELTDKVRAIEAELTAEQAEAEAAIEANQGEEPDEDDGVRYARAMPSFYRQSGLSVDTAAAYLKSKIGPDAYRKLVESGVIRVSQATDGRLARNVRAAMADGDIVYGYTDDDTTHLIADNLNTAGVPVGSTEDAYGIFLHEVGVHYGMEAFLGRKQFVRLKRSVMRAAQSGADTPLARAARKARGRVVEGTKKGHVAEETLAWLVTDHANHTLPLVRQIMAAIRAFLVRLGWTSAANPDALVVLARGAAMRAAGRRRTDAATLALAADTMFARRIEDYAWSEVIETDAGPWYVGRDISLIPAGVEGAGQWGDGSILLAIDTYTQERLAKVIVGRDGTDIHTLYGLYSDAPRSGAGRRIVKALTANATGPLKIDSIVRDAQQFWLKVGAHNHVRENDSLNAEITRESFRRAEEEARRQGAARDPADPDGGPAGDEEGQQAVGGTRFARARVTDTPAFRHWFGDSKVVDESGEPQVMYHGTDPESRGDFTRFRMGQTEGDAFQLALSGIGPGFFTDRPRQASTFGDFIIPAYLSLQNPAVFETDMQAFAAYVQAEDVVDFFNADTEEMTDGQYLQWARENRDRVAEFKAAKKIRAAWWEGQNDAFNQVIAAAEEAMKSNPGLSDGAALRRVLQEKGHDGVIFKDTLADSRDGIPATWAVPFGPEKIKSATGNRGTFDAGNPDIRFARQRPNQPPIEDAPEIEDSLFTRARAAVEPYVDTFRHQAQDKFHFLRKAQQQAMQERGVDALPESEDAYLAELRYHGMTGAEIEDFQTEHVDPLLEVIQKSGIEVEKVDQYLHARHAPEANAQLRKINPTEEELEERRVEAAQKMDLALLARLSTQPPYQGDNTALSGMSDAEAAEVIAAARAAGDLPVLEDIARRVDAITAMRRRLLEESGLETKATIATWEDTYEHYVPLKREHKGRALPRRGSGYDTRGKEKRRAGSNKAVVHVLANVIAQHEATILRANKAKVGQAFLEFARNNPNPDLYEVDRIEYKPQFTADGLVRYRPDPGFVLADNVFVVRQGGVEHAITFNDEHPDAMRIAGALKNLGANDAGVLVRALNKFTRWLALVNTGANPEFIISNFVRDIQTAGYNLSATDADKLKWTIIGDVGKAWRGIRQWQKGERGSEWAQQFDAFRKAGAQTGWLQSYRDIEDREKALKDKIRDMGDGKPAKVKRALLGLEKFIEHHNTAVENAIRLSTFKHAMANGMTEAQAARLAKELTVNFNRRGNSGEMLNALYLFFNASIQGQALILRSLTRSSKVRKLAVATIIGAAILDIWNRAMGDDDDENRYDSDAMRYTKDRNLVVMLPGGDYIKIPLPWGYNVFHVLGQVVGEALTRPDFRPEAGATRIVGAAVDAFNPIGGSNSLLQFISPTVVDPIAQWYENKDWAGRPLRPSGNPFGVDKPQSQMYWGSVRPMSRWVTDQLNQLTGGDEIRPGLIDISPEALDLIYDTVTGGAGRFVADSGSTPWKVAKGEAVESYEIPVLRKLYGRPGLGQASQDYYRNRDAVALSVAQLRHYQNDPEKVREIQAEYGDELRLRGLMKITERQLKRLRKARDAATEREQRRKVEEQMKAVMDRFNQQYFRATTREAA